MDNLRPLQTQRLTAHGTEPVKEAPTVQAEYKQKIIKDKFGTEYCYVPKMNFYFSENNTIEVIHAPFYIAKYPITVAQFHHFLKESSYNYNQLHIQMMNRISNTPDCPATPVSWWDAKYYIRWIRYVTGEYYSLPMQTEWEAACRANDARIHPWGDDPPTDLHASYSRHSPKLTTDIVGTHPLGNSPFGCADMVGNVWEWCLDTTDDETMAYCRGGSCNDPAQKCTSTSSITFPTNIQTNFVGFRPIYLPGEMFEEYKIAMNS